jgi:hypothetical protein
LIKAQVIDIDQVQRGFDVEFHQVEQIGAAGDKTRAFGLRRLRSGGGRIGAAVTERPHAGTSATSVMASMMFE